MQHPINHNFFTAIPQHGAVYWLYVFATVAAGIGVLALLQIIPTRYRKATIALFTFLGGLYYVAEFFLPTEKGTSVNALTEYQPFVGTLSQVIGAFTVGLGVISLVGMHTRSVVRQRAQWGYSACLIVAFLVMTVFHLLDSYYGDHVIIGQGGILRAAITNHDVYNFLFKGGLNSLESAMFALIGFFIISASYRAFRIRSFEASLLMISALVVMLGQVTLGTWLTGGLPTDGPYANFRFENMAQYILLNINTPAQRAVAFGIALGTLATSLRLWLSLERGFYFDQES
ncbi:MAG TPA: hypothetical protein VGK19_05990 [Capsulimonadaceae bacterium]